jgi:hypothetical protein
MLGEASIPDSAVAAVGCGWLWLAAWCVLLWPCDRDF